MIYYNQLMMEMIFVKKTVPSRRRGGFTLVELIVVLVILAILAAILVPALTGYIDKAEERKGIVEARAVATALQTMVSESYPKINTSFFRNNATDRRYEASGVIPDEFYGSKVYLIVATSAVAEINRLTGLKLSTATTSRDYLFPDPVDWKSKPSGNGTGKIVVDQTGNVIRFRICPTLDARNGGTVYEFDRGRVTVYKGDYVFTR